MEKILKLQYIIGSIWGVFATASPAYAVSLTNLDTVAHEVQIEVAGEVLHKPIQPRQTIRLSPQRQTLTLMSKQDNQSIEAKELNEYVIWPGGELKLQRRIRTGTRGGGLQ